jgi:hypothetical protein
MPASGRARFIESWIPIFATITFAACGGGGELTVPPTTGTIEITTATTGTQPDLDGYSVQMDAQPAQAIANEATVRVSQVSPGNHVVHLGEVAANCAVALNPITVAVQAGEISEVNFTVNCGSTTGGVTVTVTTGGTSLDVDGYSVSVDGVDRGPLGVNAEVTIGDLAPGSHVVGLSGMAANCQIQGDNLQLVNVSAGANARLAYNISCVAPPAGAGSLRIRTETSNAQGDPDGYAISVDGLESQPIEPNATTIITNLAPGAHTVQLVGVAGNCSVQGTNPQTVNVVADASTGVTFVVDCRATQGALQVTTSTTGQDQDQNGYQFSVDGGPARAIGVSGSETLSNISAGNHTVVLTGVATNCTVNDANQTVTVTSGSTATAAFAITCSAVPPARGSIRVTTSTSGEDQDNGYQFSIDDGSARSIGPNGSEDVGNVSPGNHTVELTGVASNCTVNDAAQTVTVTPGNVATAAFSITCTAIPPAAGSIRVTTNTSGPDQDTDGYEFTIEGDPPRSIGTSGTETVTGVPPGSYNVVLSGVAENCTVDGASEEVTVTGGATSNVSFSVTCTETTPPGPSASRSSMLANPKNVPTGGTSTITVTVRDANGDRLEGVPVSLSSSGEGNTISPESATTDANGEATFTFSSVEAGDKTIRATAGGVTLDDTEVITVAARSSSTEITSVTPEPSTSGESIHVTVSVTAGGGTPTGTVAIFSDQETGGCDAAPISGGTATCDFALTVTGTHTIRATYSGDDEFEGSSDPDGQEHVVN